MKEIIYRLGDYKIIESDTGSLHWETHSGIGMLKEGMCYLKGDILFIGPVETRKEGFLKLEFIESFKSAEFWSKTRFFCINAEIFYCLNGKKVTREERLQWRAEKRHVKESDETSPASNGSDKAEGLMSCSYRLHTYKITRMQDGDFVWSSHSGANIIKSGPCFLLEDITFLYPSRNSVKTMTRQQFTADLEQLPEWKQTRYYTDECFLEQCESVNQTREEKKLWKGFLKSKNVEPSRNGNDKGLSFSNTENQKLKSNDSKGKTRHFCKHSKIIKTLTSILFVFIVFLIMFLLINRREHSERSHYKSDEYSHRNYRKH